MLNLNKEGLRRPLLVGGTVLFLAIAAVLYVTGGGEVSTDDAYTQSARAQIIANIDGRVTQIDVKDNQQVHKGDPLLELDSREHLIAVEDARAKLAAAKLQVAALKATYGERLAAVQSSEDNAAFQQREYAREARLAAKGFTSQARLDTARHALTEAAAQLRAARQALVNARALLGGKPDIKVVMPNPVFEGIARQIEKSLVKAGGKALLKTVYTDKVKSGGTILTHVHHRQTPLFLMQGLVDAGVTWQSEAMFQEQAHHPIAHVDIPASENTTAVYAGAVVKGAAHPEAAKAWLAFIRSPQSLAIFERYGFKPYQGKMN